MSTNPFPTLKIILLKLLELILVVGYIVFEEIIWNTFAKPIFTYLKNLALLDALKQTFLDMNRYLLVSIFVVILAIAEYMGILSVITIAQNQVVLGTFIYALKIPIASFTFWLFELTKPQLMTFGWLKVSYETLMKLIDRLVNSAIYLNIKATVQAAKQRLRQLAVRLKNSVMFKPFVAGYRLFKSSILKQHNSH
ncbi:MAG: hypothetical protein HOP02_03740 [Methylococcaceae bacterium]|nr:hypothetical protein [Methylococcaceae bacterium]